MRTKFVAILIFLLACKSQSDFIRIKDKEFRLKVLAKNSERNELTVKYHNLKDEVILVCYPRERYQHYYIPAPFTHSFDIAFLDSKGVVLQIGELTADEKGTTSQQECRFALFAGSGALKSVQLKKGDVIELPATAHQAEDLPLVKIGDKAFYVEHATTSEEKSRGLMYRDHLSSQEGMLFIYPEEDFRSYWMKNTYIPLTLAYIKADGTISETMDLEPLNEQSVYSRDLVKYVLEVNRDWFKKNKIKAGDRVQIQ